MAKSNSRKSFRFHWYTSFGYDRWTMAKMYFYSVNPLFKKELRQVSDCHSGIFYDAISLLQNPVEPMRGENKVLSISLVGMPSTITTANSINLSGDTVITDSSIDFPVWS